MQYVITHSRWHNNYDVSVGNYHSYHVDNSKITPGKPDLTFHAGPDTTSPIIGSCRYHHFSSDTEIGLGDPSHSHKIELNREGLLPKRYSFRTNLSDQKPRTFTWKGTSQGSGHHNHKLVDENTQQIVALFSSGSRFSSTDGQLDIYVEYGPQFSLLALMTFLALHEKRRRARNSSAAAGGAGAGASGVGA
ncbi:hypothetical protein N7495_007282 [Penicillium taxi]|uniref:uncharacterized protein n=1 Tax=Penicillium taxi TaxID=168475 RepID=UPI0025457DA6|nr:uncharacterized protein N7495_007282 [Penicillium taxi]KAJ5895591.1 hypothetical protein N7495_007282 [Penicillium taxi]